MVSYVYADLCSLLAATSQFSILIGQNMQFTGCHNGNKMRNATCADTQISIEWHYCSFLYCVYSADLPGDQIIIDESILLSMFHIFALQIYYNYKIRSVIWNENKPLMACRSYNSLMQVINTNILWSTNKRLRFRLCLRLDNDINEALNPQKQVNSLKFVSKHLCVIYIMKE